MLKRSSKVHDGTTRQYALASGAALAGVVMRNRVRSRDSLQHMTSIEGDAKSKVRVIDLSGSNR
jgi:hypothetical protein